MSIPTLLHAVFNSLSLLMHPPVPVIDPPPEPSGAPGISDEELAKLSEASAIETIEVTSDAPAESASSVHLDRTKLRFRPRTQPSDLLRQIPGLAVSQHAGGGKADQYFIRGFDADHGTDVAIFSDGIPVNLTSHGHGQGYADTHWMIPETIETVDMHKGPYAARYGDFYTAGALEMKTLDKVEGPTVWIASGAPFGNAMRFERYDSRLVGMASPRIRKNADDATLIALQVAQNDGPFIAAQDFRQGNALVKWKGKVGPGELKLAGTWYASTWNQSGQLPESEISSGRLDRFGSIDPSEGGIASRSSSSAAYTVRDSAKRSTLRVMGYGVKNDLELYSNFTLYADDPMNGDQIGQTDDRVLFGLDAAYEKGLTLGSMEALITTGVQVRSDDVETSLFHAVQRSRLETRNHTDNGIRNVAAYIEGDLVPAEWLHIRPGLRVDAFHWQVDDLAMTTTAGNATKTIVGPKLSVEAHQSEQMAFFFNAGSGFHSNDARSAVETKGQGALARALGTEAGVRMKPHANARVSADLWYLYLTSEQVWSGDAGGTSPSDPTRRFGLDVEGSVDATSWLALDANVTWAKSTLVANQGNGGALALAPRWMGSGGVSVHDKRNFVSVRTRGIADRAGNEDATLTAKGYLLVDLIAGKKIGKLDLELTVANLFNTKWREAQFAEASRVTPTADVMEQMHFTPGMPLTATIKAAYKF